MDSEKIFMTMSEEIKNESQQTINDILAEVKSIEDQAMASIKMEAKKNADMRLKQELDDIHSQAASEISELNSQRMKKLIRKRDEYVESIFAEVLKELKLFTESKDYRAYLENKAKQACKSQFMNAVIYVREEDLQYTDLIKKAYGRNVLLQSSENIHIGGMIIEDQQSDLVLDETLEFALKTQKEWFNKNSGLVIR